MKQDTERTISIKPISIDLNKLLILRGFAHLGPSRGESLAHQTVLLGIDPLIVQFRESLELSLQGLITAVAADTGVREVHELRMKRIYRIRAVWISVYPCSGHSGVIYRKKLYNSLTCSHYPVY